MATHQSPAQRSTVKRVMHEFKHGELKTARSARKVKNPKQAIAIALHEAGASKYESPKKNARNLRRTKAKEARGETGQAAAEGRGRTTVRKGASRTTAHKAGSRTATLGAAAGKTRSELYQEARRRNIAGRSKMNKQQLERALHR
jgi:Family of unknown function (DUF6496)